MPRLPTVHRPKEKRCSGAGSYISVLLLDDPACGAAAFGEGIHENGSEQDQPRNDELRTLGQIQQTHAVVDRRDHERAQKRRHDPTGSSEQPRGPDDRGRYYVEKKLAAAGTRGHGPEARGKEDSAQPRHEPRDHEHGNTHAIDVDAGPSRRFRVAADRIDVAAEPSTGRYEGPG